MSTGMTPKTNVSRVVTDLHGALSLIHSERRIEFCASIAEGLSVACDERDVEEMFGNLMDNAFKWASSRVVVAAERDGASVRIAVVDDGPGIPIDRLQAVVLPGIREDERVPGDGFGLAIVTEVASLYGGSLSLEVNSPTGLRAILVLPAL
jgi:signal transduction histidine kinase